MKTEAGLQERSHAVEEMEKLRIEEKLQKSQRACEMLNEKIVRLSEECKLSCDRAKRAEERHESLSKEFSNMLSEKNKLIVELNGRINENEKLVGRYKEELKCLREEKLASDQLVAELKGEKCEASRSLDELRCEKMECDDRLQNLATRVVVMEIELANLLNVKVEDLARLSDFMDKFSPEAKRVDLPDIIKCWKCANDDTPLVMKGSRDSVMPQRASCAATEVIEICDSDGEAKCGDTSDVSNSAQKKRKTRPENYPYESD